MEKSVNSRVLELKTFLKMENGEFCHAAGIATGTLSNIQNGENISPKTIRTIASCLNANRDWLLHGKGKMFADKPKEAVTENLYKDELYKNMSQRISFYEEIIRNLTGLTPEKVGKLLGNLNELIVPKESYLQVA